MSERKTTVTFLEISSSQTTVWRTAGRTLTPSGGTWDNFYFIFFNYLCGLYLKYSKTYC